MSGTYATPLHLELGASRRLGAWLAAVHGLAALVLPFAVLPLPLTLLLAGAIPLSLAWHWPRHVTRTAPSCVQSLRWDGDGSC
ncbi:MAG: hypothetical protein PVI50_05655, partial [Gammaproteobacteria bacterium]